MTFGCVILLCHSTPVYTVADHILENEIKMLLPHMSAGYIKVCVVRSTVLPATQIDFLSFGEILPLGYKFSDIPHVVTEESLAEVND